MIQYLQHAPGRTVVIDNKEYLFFSGYSYLGMSHVPSFVQLAKEGIDRWGLLHPSARISNTRIEVYGEMERLLSALTTKEETVLFSSGYIAGRAVTELFADYPHVYIAPGSHPAIQLRSIELNDDWKTHIVEESVLYNDVVLLVDSVYPLSATINDFSFLHRLPQSSHITCIIDDSHAIGVVGEKGEGVTALLPRLPNVEYVICYSLSKAFHINGGAVSCSKAIAERLRTSPYYTASTALAPFLAHAFIHGQELYDEQRKKLRNNIEAFQLLLADVDIVQSDDRLPVFILPKEYNQSYFDPHLVVISSFPYPDPAGEVINRIVLSALHTNEDLDQLARLIKSIT
jgi:8-amino-7-oxononanoate synthase